MGVDGSIEPIDESKLARCANGDEMEGVKFPKDTLAYKFQSNPENLSENEMREAIVAAFRVWTSVTTIGFLEVSRGEEADVTFDFSTITQTDDGMGPKVVQTINSGNGKIIVFNSDTKWINATPEENSTKTFDLRFAALHAIGHELGFDHSPYSRSVMYPIFLQKRSSLNYEQRDLDEFDVENAKKFYGSMYETVEE
ncbi:unnamed protein product, partial [Mesorhabditis belari]|uniref:Peptidase metallopeptidase domain-containing protein n=1 Tax=Mesorhabditis belari TaxID=2138241 RepID=A0AAF3EMY4_9BILA